MGKNRIIKIENLKNLPHLSILSLRINQITKIENLEALIQLTHLSLNQNQIEKIEAKSFEQNQFLTGLRLANNPVVQLDSGQTNILEEIQKLETLLPSCKVTLKEN